MTDGKKKNKNTVCAAGYFSLADRFISYLPRFYKNKNLELQIDERN